MPVSATVQAPVATGLLDNTTQSIPAQRIDSVPTAPDPGKTRVELLHARIAQLIAADYTGRAHVHRTARETDLAARAEASAVAFENLAVRLANAFRGARQIVRTPDLDALRWYELTLLHAHARSQKRRECTALRELLEDAVAGHVENLVGVRHA